jgi:hypothetical protein
VEQFSKQPGPEVKLQRAKREWNTQVRWLQRDGDDPPRTKLGDQLVYESQRGDYVYPKHPPEVAKTAGGLAAPDSRRDRLKRAHDGWCCRQSRRSKN